MDENNDRLSEQTHKQILLDKVLPKSLISDVSAQDHPKAILLAGQPGAGKGGLVNAASLELQGDVVLVDPDELRSYHPGAPEFRLENPYTWSGRTHADASQWADELLEATIAGKKNLVFDTTLSNGQWASDLIQDLRSKGYDVEVRAIASPKLESEFGVDERFSKKIDNEGYGRYVPEGARDAIYGKLPVSLDTIHDRTGVPIRIFDREGVQHYDSRIDARTPGQALEETRLERLKNPAHTERLRAGWDAQVQWHNDLPQNSARNPNLDPPTRTNLLAEHSDLKIAENALARQQGIATIDALVRPNAPQPFATPAEPHLPRMPRAAVLAGASALGVAASAYDAHETGEKVSSLLAQDNPLAAQSQLLHYGARGSGGWLGGAAAGLAVGWETGPGAAAFVAVGAIAGSQVGERAAQWWDERQVYRQTDRDGVEWRSDGRQWLRQDTGDLHDDGVDAPARQAFSATPEKARELDYRASNTATALAMGNLPPPRDPHVQPASAGDAPSLAPADWRRDGDSGEWRRDTVVARTDRGHPLTRTDVATPERAAELDTAATQTLRDNLAHSPAAIAARYDASYRANGWQQFGEKPAAVATALAEPTRLTASDGELYRLTENGAWQRERDGEAASANVGRELEGTRALLQPALAQHAEQMAGIPEPAPPTRESIDRAALQSAYAAAGVAPAPERIDAALEAVQRTREAQGIDPATSALYVQPDAHGHADIHSSIAHLQRDAQGVVRVAAVTSGQEVELARMDLRAASAPLPQSPELRIDPLSPQQRDAQEQSVREANRQGLSHDQVQQVAAAAPIIAAAATTAAAAPDTATAAAVEIVEPARAPPKAAPPERTPAEPDANARMQHDERERAARPQPSPQEQERQRSSQREDAERNRFGREGDAQLSPQDQAMFAKIRSGAPQDVSDETVAWAMVAAKRGGIGDAEQIGPVGVANGKLWVGSAVPGLHAQVPLGEQAPPMQQSLRDAQTLERERETQRTLDAQRRAQSEAAERGPRL